MSRKNKRNYKKIIDYDEIESNVIDLHGLNIYEAIAEIQFAIANAKDNLELEYNHILVIIGKGTGTIKAYIEEFLRDSNYKYEFNDDCTTIKIYIA
ncbi:Smr/MutS family protein [Mycoplasmopsis primatum]|uniref:Smr/MutS family protein n=1 Tax=Mycoplasmopsis primatum TaxID=55604 RepID=UPI0004975E1B|nr:Smr/MutS family protein [Mycoplasmopsis primatum]